MKYLSLLLLPLLLLSCSKSDKKEPPFDSFVYSFTSLHQDYMIKLNKTDTLYFWKRFPKPETVGYAIMENPQRDSIVAIVSKIDLSKYKSEYTEQETSDATGLRYDLLKNGKLKSINIYGDTAPKELYNHAVKLNEVIKRLNFQPYNGMVDFGKPIRPIVD